jgi:xanthine permease XanP
LYYGLNDKPPLHISFLLALQNLILVIPGTIIAPLIIIKALNLPDADKEMIIFMSILMSGISTFIQIKKIGKLGSGYVLFMGTSGAFISVSIAAGMAGGFGLISAMAILSAPLEIVLSYFLRYVRKIITPAIGGIAIILIAISLLPIFMNLWTGIPGTEAYYSSANLITGGVTIVVTILFAIFGSCKVRLWSPIMGIMAGIICGYITGITDFSPLKNYPWIGIPQGKMIFPDFNFQPHHLPIFFSFLFATLASTLETVGDTITIQSVSQENMRKVDYEAIQGSLYADGFSSMLSAVFGSIANTTYSGNIAVVSITGVAARQVGIIASVLLATLAFFPKLIYSITYIPDPVMGGSSLVLLAVLFASGIKLIGSTTLDHKQGMIIGISLTVGIISTFQLFFQDLLAESLKPFLNNGIATGGFTAVGLNFLTKFRLKKRMSIKLKYDLSELVELQQILFRLKTDYNLNDEQFYGLQLCCEEIFAFLSLENSEAQGMVSFSFLIEEEGVRVYIKDTSDTKDIDLVEQQEITSENQTELGLVLVNRIAEELEHIKIGNHNEISFVIRNSVNSEEIDGN